LTNKEIPIFELLAELDRVLMEREAVRNTETLNRLSFLTLNEYRESLIEHFEGGIKILQLQIARLKEEIASNPDDSIDHS
jgi:hypothetical protein